MNCNCRVWSVSVPGALLRQPVVGEECNIDVRDRHNLRPTGERNIKPLLYSAAYLALLSATPQLYPHAVASNEEITSSLDICLTVLEDKSWGNHWSCWGWGEQRRSVGLQYDTWDTTERKQKGPEGLRGKGVLEMHSDWNQQGLCSADPDQRSPGWKLKIQAFFPTANVPYEQVPQHFFV